MTAKKPDDLPSDVDAERAVLGGLFLSNDLFFEDAEELSADDFFLPSHQSIFRVINDLLYGTVEGASNADIITISAELRKRGELERIGGSAFLASLTEGLPRRLNLKEYVQIIQQKARLRKLTLIGHDLYLNSKHEFADANILTEQLQQALLAVEADERTTAVAVGDITTEIEDRVMKMRNLSLDKTEMELTWGIEALDQKTKGAFGGELTVVGGDSGSGKTIFAIQMAVENALKGCPVGIFSMEMEKRQLAQRIYPILSQGLLTAAHMRDPRGMTLHTHVPELRRISALIKKLPIWIDDTSPLTLNKFIARAKMMKRKHAIRLVLADYLQLIKVPGQKELEEVKAVMFGCRDYVKTDPTMHMVLLSQYAKEGLFKKKRRTKGDLYGGAVIHQAAQNVLLITVESPDKKEPGSNLDVEIMVDKARESTPGRVVCQRDSQSLRYIPASPEPEKKEEKK